MTFGSYKKALKARKSKMFGKLVNIKMARAWWVVPVNISLRNVIPVFLDR